MKQLDQKLNKYLVYRIPKEIILLPCMIVIGFVMVTGMCIGEAYCNIIDE